jgi:hypothetical protein
MLLKVTEFPSVSPSINSIPDVASHIHMNVAWICYRMLRTRMEPAVHRCSLSPKPDRTTLMALTDTDLPYD